MRKFNLTLTITVVGLIILGCSKGEQISEKDAPGTDQAQFSPNGRDGQPKSIKGGRTEGQMGGGAGALSGQ